MKASAVDDELLAKAQDQRVALRVEAQAILHSLMVGLERYWEKDWQWDPKDMAATNPDDWRRCAKMALLFAQLDALKHALEWQASTRPLAPFWCPQCALLESGKKGFAAYPGAPYLKWECLQHDSTPASAANWADAIWGTK
jgi:hypothetical protein